MKASGGSVIGGRRRDRSLSAFLVADVAFVCVLLVATSLVVTTFILVSTADLGFDRRNVMTLDYQRFLNEVARKDRPHAAAALRADLMARASSVPGVTSVAISMNGGPLSGGSVRYSLIIPGIGETQRDDWLETNMVTPGYFHTMGMEVIRGRPFEASDGSGAPRVMLINDVAVRRFFPDRDPVGQIVTFQGSQTTIIGVLRGVHFDGPEVEVPPAMYTPIDQFAGAPNIGVLLVRTTGDPRVLSGKVHDAIRPALGGSEPNLPRFIDDGFRRLTAGRRFNAGLMAIFGFIALAIGAIGVYGTTSFVVVQQIPAIGLRMTLGASPTRVLRSVLREALRDVALGVGIGLAGAWALSGALASFVFGIRATDPLVYAAVGGFLAVVGTAAAFVPAMRAARLDPLTALRRY
jgi:putative ABC transport system permease protein